MHGSFEEPHDVVHTLENSRLLRAMRLHNRSEDPRAKEIFLQALCQSTVIVFTGAEVDKSRAIPVHSGYCRYEIGTEIPVGLLHDPVTGISIMPVFTSVDAFRAQSMLQLEHCLAMSAVQAMELMLSTESIIFAIDPGSPYSLELPRETAHFLVAAVSGKKTPTFSSQAMMI